jgi:hypothetical protein
MARLPASYIRGFAVLTLGATFVLGHAAFAAPHSSAQPETPIQMALVMGPDGEERHQDLQGIELAENCYLEEQKHRTPKGKVISRIVHECD